MNRIAERDISIDNLKVFASIAIIILHISARYLNHTTVELNNNFWIANFFDSFTRWSVPIFVMTSGRFLLSKSPDESLTLFYKKRFGKILIHFLFWAIIYVLYAISLKVIHKSTTQEILIEPLKLLTGRPFFHLWFIYMLIGLYVITPYLIKLKSRMSENNFLILGCALILLGLFSQYLKIYVIRNNFFWGFWFLDYLGYFILGNTLATIKFPIRQLNIGFVILFLTGSLATTILTYYAIKSGDQSFYFYNYLSPTTIIASVSIYILFSNLISNSFYKVHFLSKYTYGIYLVHALLLIFIYDYIKFENVFLGIIFTTLMVFITSLSVVYLFSRSKFFNRFI